ncbi:ester cyclase [Sorangium sp. So ce385]|uniref:ester cyclase n=1 Tax=Sorangium sp. So ce385 TaxID=3133308 RepID=UPI003F5BC21F
MARPTLKRAVLSQRLLFFLALAMVAGCAPLKARSPSSSGPTPDEVHHEAAVRRYFDEVWSQGRLEVLDELLAPGYINHTPSTPNPPPGPDGLKPIVAAFRVAFPNLHFTIEDLVVKDDRVAVRVRMEGDHEGPLFGIAATHRRVSVKQINIELFRGGKIAEHWRVTDELGLMRQLGVVR